MCSAFQVMWRLTFPGQMQEKGEGSVSHPDQMHEGCYIVSFPLVVGNYQLTQLHCRCEASVHHHRCVRVEAYDIEPVSCGVETVIHLGLRSEVV